MCVRSSLPVPNLFVVHNRGAASNKFHSFTRHCNCATKNNKYQYVSLRCLQIDKWFLKFWDRGRIVSVCKLHLTFSKKINSLFTFDFVSEQSYNVSSISLSPVPFKLFSLKGIT